MENPSQRYGASPAMWDHTVSPTTRYSPARQAGTWFTYPGGMDGWVDLGVGYMPRWFTCPQTVTHPWSNHLIATWLANRRWGWSNQFSMLVDLHYRNQCNEHFSSNQVFLPVLSDRNRFLQAKKPTVKKNEASVIFVLIYFFWVFTFELVFHFRCHHFFVNETFVIFFPFRPFPLSLTKITLKEARYIHIWDVGNIGGEDCAGYQLHWDLPAVSYPRHPPPKTRAWLVNVFRL